MQQVNGSWALIVLALGWRGLLAYAIGLAAQWPFVYQPDYTGPLVGKLGGADISWIVGWFVAAGVYLLLARVGSDRPGPALEPASSSAEAAAAG